MRRSSESEEREQFTVAELLARYGEPSPTAGRRRRRAGDSSDSGAGSATQSTPQPVTEPSWAASRALSAPLSDPLPPPEVPASQRFTPAEPSRIDSLRRDSNQIEVTQPGLRSLNGRDWSPAVTSPPGTASQIPRVPPVAAGPPPRTGLMGPGSGPVTDQIPRFDPAPGDLPSWSSRRAGGDPSGTVPPTPVRASPAQPATTQIAGSQPPAGLGTATSAVPAQSGSALITAPAPDAEADATADEEPESGSPWWEWAVMVSQIGIGVVGGATLWLICEWLWQRIPVVALVVALAVITGLVWVVRRVRRAEDLQTTVIAVLVGLFVTVSPAALLLVGR